MFCLSKIVLDHLLKTKKAEYKFSPKYFKRIFSKYWSLLCSFSINYKKSRYRLSSKGLYYFGRLGVDHVTLYANVSTNFTKLVSSILELLQLFNIFSTKLCSCVEVRTKSKTCFFKGKSDQSLPPHNILAFHKIRNWIWEFRIFVWKPRGLISVLVLNTRYFYHSVRQNLKDHSSKIQNSSILPKFSPNFH